MSSFSDNFKRDSEEDMLEYDDSAFYYFSISVLTFLLIPYTLSLLYTMCVGEVQIESFPSQCKCSRCTALITLKKREARAMVYRGPFYFRVVVAAFFWYLWYLNASKVASIESLQTFDPFQILDVSSDATIRDIKKQYRRLSLEKHPDKNPDNPLAVQEFIRITKAYNVSVPSRRHWASLRPTECADDPPSKTQVADLFLFASHRFLRTRQRTKTSRSTATPTARAATAWLSRCRASFSRRRTRSRCSSARSSSCSWSCRASST